MSDATPDLLYGTAWKEEATETCVREALVAGFRGIDTANQRKHYFEAGVGAALRRARDELGIRREELFLQTKFTFLDGQDHRLPYDPLASVREQVAQSFARSLEHLGVERLDSYVLHGPSTGGPLADADWEAWGAMEAVARAGGARFLGVSNVSAAQLAELVARAEVRPRFVQNRCYARTGWDRRVRELCREHGMTYQGFSLLTANPRALAHPELLAVARRLGATPAQVVFRFARRAGMLPLTGTTDPAHMREDLAACALALTDADVAAIETLELR